MRSEKRPEGGENIYRVDICGKMVPGRGNKNGKAMRWETNLACLKTSKEASVA